MEITFEQLPQAVGQLLVKVDQIEKLLQQNNFSTHSEPEQPLTIQQAAKFLNLAVPTVYTLVSQQVLPHSKKGKRLYFSKPELTEWVQSGRKKTILEIEAEATTFKFSKNKRG
ncbi:helix-turn-helix domain-containing protein [Adhaeribacter radiodurans]|uniref:Helix-turn-helix domain-containing protein n=1 Tax=Adhaeribacter radiodurans TaxID=2745197 RepID=A0A7L7LCM4_9BACT|nr:helix-turn-helix domain-containing protein [Adhaeribacter radiodurans]QMU30497.1 helix-turn-helix domain-containing protein [Adhaeribacter radiodurans]